MRQLVWPLKLTTRASAVFPHVKPCIGPRLQGEVSMPSILSGLGPPRPSFPGFRTSGGSSMSENAKKNSTLQAIKSWETEKADWWFAKLRHDTIDHQRRQLCVHNDSEVLEKKWPKEVEKKLINLGGQKRGNHNFKVLFLQRGKDIPLFENSSQI